MSLIQKARIFIAGQNIPGLLPVLTVLAPLLMGIYGVEEPSAGTLATPLRFLLATLCLSIIVGLVVKVPTAGFAFLAGVLLFLGTIRRELIPLLGYDSNDPLTLIGAVSGFLLVVRIVAAGKIQQTALSVRITIALLIIMVLQIFNPLQGGILVGFGGALFYIGPLLWYYVGRNYPQIRMLEILCTMILVGAILIAFLGLKQQYIGFSNVEQYWMLVSKYKQNLVEGAVRVCGASLSFGEYVTLLTMGVAIAWVRFVLGRFVYGIPFLFLLLCVFLSSSRGCVVMVLAGCAVTWGMLERKPVFRIPRILLGVAIGAAGLIFGLSQAKAVRFEGPTAVFIQHQVEGLTDPLNSERSTATKHAGLLQIGFSSGLRNPLGQGLGSTTIAGRRFAGSSENGSSGTFSTELDFTNIIVSTGAIGGIIYMLLMARIAFVLVWSWDKNRQAAVLQLIGLATVTFGNWLQGGYYAPSILMWLCFGIVDGRASLDNIDSVKLPTIEKIVARLPRPLQSIMPGGG